VKKEIHPKYYPEAQVICACGNTWTSGSTQPEIRTEMCSACHPFFTGEQRIVDTAGQVERFERRRRVADELQGELAKREAEKKEREETIFELVAEGTESDEGAILTKEQAAAVAEAMLEPEFTEPTAVEANKPQRSRREGRGGDRGSRRPNRDEGKPRSRPPRARAEDSAE